MPGFTDSVLDCLKDFSKFTKMEMISFIALTVVLTCKNFKYKKLILPSKAFKKKHQSLRDITDVLNLVQEPQDEISHDISGVSTGPVTTKTVQASITADSKKKSGKTHYDDRKFNIVIYGINM